MQHLMRRLGKSLTKEVRDNIPLLAYWPVYLLLFVWIERFVSGPYNVIHCGLDDAVPFCEGFVLPYFMWFPYLAGMLLFTFFREPDAFRRLMKYFILTFTAAVLIYRLFPSCQQLRPVSFQRDNLFVQAVRFLYWIDTPTNICPSEHVIGSAGVVFAAWSAKKLKKTRWYILALGLLISISTLFLKQHSILDHLAAVPVCAAGWFLCFRVKERE